MVDLSEEVVRRTLEAIRASELTDTAVIDEVDRVSFALSRSSVEIGNEVITLSVHCPKG